MNLALGAPCDAVYTAGEFRDHVVDAVNRLERDDIEVAEALVDTLRERMPCLEHPPDPNLLADLRVVESILAFADGRNWQGPLESALRIRPTVDRIVGRAHPTHAWTPPATPPPTLPIDTEHRVYVDGRIATVIPATPGWYVVQKTDGEFWNTALYRGARPSLDWVTSPVEHAPSLDFEAHVGATFGTVLSFQNTSHSPAGIRAYDLVPCLSPTDEDPCRFGNTWDPRINGLYGVRVEGTAWFYGPTGLHVSGDYQLGMGDAYRSGRAVVLTRFRRWNVGVGVGAADTIVRSRSQSVVDSLDDLDLLPDDDQSTKLPRGFLALHVGRTGRPDSTLDGWVDVGIRPFGDVRVEGLLRHTIPRGDRLLPTLSGSLAVARTGLEAVGIAEPEDETPGYTVDVVTIAVGLAVGARFRGRL